MAVLVLLSDGLESWAKFAAPLVLCGHVDVGKKCEGQEGFIVVDPIGNYAIGTSANGFHVFANLLAHVQGVVYGVDDLLRHIGHVGMDAHDDVFEDVM